MWLSQVKRRFMVPEYASSNPAMEFERATYDRSCNPELWIILICILMSSLLFAMIKNKQRNNVSASMNEMSHNINIIQCILKFSSFDDITRHHCWINTIWNKSCDFWDTKNNKVMLNILINAMSHSVEEDSWIFNANYNNWMDDLYIYDWTDRQSINCLMLFEFFMLIKAVEIENGKDPLAFNFDGRKAITTKFSTLWTKEKHEERLQCFVDDRTNTDYIIIAIKFMIRLQYQMRRGDFNDIASILYHSEEHGALYANLWLIELMLNGHMNPINRKCYEPFELKVTSKVYCDSDSSDYWVSNAFYKSHDVAYAKIKNTI
eukprot:83760_1